MAVKDFKIAILGLANAGKTSFVKSLAKEFDVLFKLAPTKGVDRQPLEFMGKNLMIWDFGGQVSYREKYLKNPEMYFYEIAVVYYFVDVQDAGSTKAAIEYFLEVMGFVQKYSPQARLALIFHKTDPEFEIPEGNAGVKAQFLQGVEPYLSEHQIPANVYDTTIYNTLGILTAFAQPLVGRHELYQNITQTLKRFCDANDLPFAVLFTENLYELGFHVSDTTTPKYMNDRLQDFFRLLDRHFDKTTPAGVVYDKADVISAKFTIQFGGVQMRFYVTLGYPVDIDDNQRDRFRNLTQSLASDLKKLFLNVDLADIWTRAKRIENL